MDKRLHDTRMETELLLERIQRAEGLYGKKGFKTALNSVRQQSMVMRKNLKELRPAIIEELKKREK